MIPHCQSLSSFHPSRTRPDCDPLTSCAFIIHPSHLLSLDSCLVNVVDCSSVLRIQYSSVDVCYDCVDAWTVMVCSQCLSVEGFFAFCRKPTTRVLVRLLNQEPQTYRAADDARTCFVPITRTEQVVG